MSRYSASSEEDVPNISLERGDPAAPSDTATLLRLHPNHLSHLRRLAPKRLLHRLRVLQTLVV